MRVKGWKRGRKRRKKRRNKRRVYIVWLMEGSGSGESCYKMSEGKLGKGVGGRGYESGCMEGWRNGVWGNGRMSILSSPLSLTPPCISHSASQCKGGIGTYCSITVNYEAGTIGSHRGWWYDAMELTVKDTPTSSTPTPKRVFHRSGCVVISTGGLLVLPPFPPPPLRKSPSHTLPCWLHTSSSS